MALKVRIQPKHNYCSCKQSQSMIGNNVSYHFKGLVHPKIKIM